VSAAFATPEGKLSSVMLPMRFLKSVATAIDRMGMR
jgi:hypothetical protein